MRIRSALTVFMVALTPLSAALAPSAGGSPNGHQSSEGSASFTDPAGDAQGGPDVTRVAISGDAATGALELSVAVAGFEPAASDGRERDVLVWLDTDRNRSTGDPEDGSEYALQAWNDESGGWWNMIRWNGAVWEPVPQSATMRVTSQDNSVTFALATADLGGSASFRFYVVAGTWNLATESFDTRDEAPDLGWWSYDIAASSPPPPTPPRTKIGLVVGALRATPAEPRAARQFSLSVPIRLQRTQTISVFDLETGETRESLVVSWEPVRSGTYTARITVGGTTLRRSGLVRGRELQLSLVVPKTAAGKLLRVTLKVTATDKETGKTLTAKRIASFRIK